MSNIIEDLRNDEGLMIPQYEKKDRKGLFVLKSGNQWLADAKRKPIPNPLFMNGVWNEFELGVLFADTGVGKSILAVQIGEEIARNQKVIYFDFELTDKQFEKRYSENYTNHYVFPDNFIRAEINTDGNDYEDAGFNTLEDYIASEIEKVISHTETRILIVDNLTYLKRETEKAKDALPLMKELNELKKKYGLSILALAHTPKRNMMAPITQNDLAGSKMLINFCDSAFTIGRSAKDGKLRYLKQIKFRNTENIYSEDNVAIFEMTKKGSFLSLVPVRGVHGVQTSNEHEHLKSYSKEEKAEVRQMAFELSNQGKAQRVIARELGIGLGTVNNYLNGK